MKLSFALFLLSVTVCKAVPNYEKGYAELSKELSAAGHFVNTVSEVKKVIEESSSTRELKSSKGKRIKKSKSQNKLDQCKVNLAESEATVKLLEGRLYNLEGALEGDDTTGGDDSTSGATVKALRAGSPQERCTWNAQSILTTIGTYLIGIAAIALGGGEADALFFGTVGTDAFSNDFAFITSLSSFQTCSKEDADNVYQDFLQTDRIEREFYEIDLSAFNEVQNAYADATRDDKDLLTKLQPSQIDSLFLTKLEDIVLHCNAWYTRPDGNLDTAVIAAQFCGQVYINTAHMEMIKMSQFDKGSEDCRTAGLEVQTTTEKGVEMLEAAYHYFSNATLEEGVRRFCTGRCAPRTTPFCWRFDCNPFCDYEWRSSFTCVPGNSVAFPAKNQRDGDETFTAGKLNYCADNCRTGDNDIYEFGNNGQTAAYENSVRDRFREQVFSQRDKWWWGTGENGNTGGAAHLYNALVDFQNYGSTSISEWTQNICRDDNSSPPPNPPNPDNIGRIQCSSHDQNLTSSCGECLRKEYTDIPPLENYVSSYYPGELPPCAWGMNNPDLVSCYKSDTNTEIKNPQFNVRTPPSRPTLEVDCNQARIVGGQNDGQPACKFDRDDYDKPPKCIPSQYLRYEAAS